MTTLSRDAQLATLSNAAYLDNPPNTIGDWIRYADPIPHPSGFFGIVYVNSIINQFACHIASPQNLLGS